MTEQGPMGILARKCQDWLIEALESILAEAGLPLDWMGGRRVATESG